MGVVISGIVAAVVLGVVAAFLLPVLQETAFESYSTTSTRVGDPGANLVGEEWTGNPGPRRGAS
jgi:hypothetical protein